jgi:hypothetical protein
MILRSSAEDENRPAPLFGMGESEEQVSSIAANRFVP